MHSFQRMNWRAQFAPNWTISAKQDNSCILSYKTTGIVKRKTLVMLTFIHNVIGKL